MPRLSKRQAIYELEVTLRESDPRIWRRVLVPGATTLDRLHEIVQATMLWESYHLYEFQVGGGEEGYGAARYGVYEPEFADEEPPGDARHTALATIAPAVGATFVYAYDFGDNWRHDIIVRSIERPDKRLTYPLCIAGERAGPPEDCGGVWGYRDLLATLATGRGEAYDDMLRWLGGDFDPDGFDRNMVNRRIRDLHRAAATA